ncbi:MAG: C40 family peptidase [Bacillota bacterium]
MAQFPIVVSVCSVILLSIVILVSTMPQGVTYAAQSDLCFVKAGIVDVRAQPGDGAERVTQAHLGTAVRVVEHAGDWSRVVIPAQGDYPGWIRTSHLVPAAKAGAFAAARQLAAVRVARTAVYSGMHTESPTVMQATLGARFAVLGRTAGFVHVALPDGGTGYVREEAVAAYRSDGMPPRRRVQDIIDTAMQLVGTPYLWGGMSTDGVDCSGFVYTVFYVNGVALPRDASDQYKAGTSVGRPGLIPGDLVFYSTYSAGASHVGIYIGNSKVIQSGAKTKGVAVIDLDDPSYGPKYIGARRVLEP